MTNNLAPDEPNNMNPDNIIDNPLKKKTSPPLKTKPVTPKKSSSKPTSKTKKILMEIKYKLAWGAIYKKSPNWRQKEIDASIKSNMFGTTRWDEDFIKQVIYLAEKDDATAPLTVGEE